MSVPPFVAIDTLASALAGATATLEITRVWTTSDEDWVPKEGGFRAADDGPPWSVSFSGDASTVTLTDAEGNTYVGERTAGEPLTYFLGEGTFAGGQFLIAPAASGYVAEISIWGSGIPVISSQLGVMSVEP